MSLKQISIVIIAKNAEAYLSACLDSVSDFDNVVVYLNNSTDSTEVIARSFNNVTVVEGYFDGFGNTKNRASSYANNDWVFSLDSDEILTEALLSTLKNLKLDDAYLYQVERLNHYNEQAVTCCGWGNDYVLRLYHRLKTEYFPKAVHESLDKKQLKIIELEGVLKHYPFNSIKGLMAKADSYSELFAKDNYKPSSIFKVISHSLAMFIKCYFFKKGYSSGYIGFLISYFNAFGTALKYLKLLDHKLTCSLIITTYNRPDALELSLLSALNQSELPLEIIVADDGSRVETEQLINNMNKTSPIPIIHSWQKDDGFRAAKSRNKAIAKSKGIYTVIIDGDMVLHAHFIEDHLKAAVPKTYLQGSRVLMNDEKTNKYIASKGIKAPALDEHVKNKINGFYLPWLSKAILSKKTKSHKGVRSCNMSFFKSDALKVNGFNEAFVTWGREDSEFVERLFNSGIKRRNLKFSGIQYHLYHPEGSARQENDAVFNQTINQRLAWCEQGIDQYLS